MNRKYQSPTCILLALLFTSTGQALGEVLDDSLLSRQTANSCLLGLPDMPGGFTERRQVDFSVAKAGDDAAGLLRTYGLSISNYPVASQPVTRDFRRENVRLGDGTLDLHVNAYSEADGTLYSAEVLTDDTFKYASVRTVLKSSRTPGVVQGNFFFLNDNQEIDFEILTSTINTATPCVPAGIWAVNQPLTPGQSSTSQPILLSFDPADDFHEYRVDWSANATTFYIDGEQRAVLTTNIPTEFGRWIWNAWSSGDPCWSNGPPQADSITQIRSIDIFTGYSDSAASCPGTPALITQSTSTSGPRSSQTSSSTRPTSSPPTVSGGGSATNTPITPNTDSDSDIPPPSSGALRRMFEPLSWVVLLPTMFLV
ncbi:hypothetical protein CVT24_012341 [Panaeolus cyanescens]|uniref:GH16 domain-containing protein n=1 Tax=Panaeolus cyanescens TaxID=181874 RepID=A0A409VYF9_9AGAR|nr:hypothetical protein CVT24_012341 [Panaeolus cyanescens]